MVSVSFWQTDRKTDKQTIRQSRNASELSMRVHKNDIDKQKPRTKHGGQIDSGNFGKLFIKHIL